MTNDSRARVIPIRRRASNVDQLTDEALVAACVPGDPSALAQLFDRFCDDVTRFLGRLAYVDVQDVQDLVSDVFLAAFRNAGTYQRRSGVKTWLFAISGNIARDKCRRATRGRGALEQISRHGAGAEPATVEHTAISKELIEHVEQCLPRLPHDLRVAFLMCDVEELPGVEVARALGIPKGTLYRRLYEARQQLRRCVEGEEP